MSENGPKNLEMSDFLNSNALLLQENEISIAY